MHRAIWRARDYALTSTYPALNLPLGCRFVQPASASSIHLSISHSHLPLCISQLLSVTPRIISSTQLFSTNPTTQPTNELSQPNASYTWVPPQENNLQVYQYFHTIWVSKPVEVWATCKIWVQMRALYVFVGFKSGRGTLMSHKQHQQWLKEVNTWCDQGGRCSSICEKKLAVKTSSFTNKHRNCGVFCHRIETCWGMKWTKIGNWHPKQLKRGVESDWVGNKHNLKKNIEGLGQ